ncbi:LacI family DNA-binding transcriptional regulator [Carnimonas bestiolae]|uniref:LacI family DNA-binding transcriptional regulator n=1 Tax=Carnimonas bestiolae TaxID=3402172 RepID=UPI003EDC2045
MAYSSAYPPKRATILQVAKDAGVSKTSVSRYLGEGRRLLSEPMQQRIAHSIERLNFKPDRIASSLRGRRTRLIGMVVTDITNPYTVQVMRSIENALYQRGYTLMVCNTDSDPELETNHLQVLQSYNVEGIILHTSSGLGDTLGTLDHGQTPVVLIDRTIEGAELPCISLDNTQAMALGIDHVREQGFRHLLYITQPLGGFSSREARAQAFDKQLKRQSTLSGERLELNDNDAEAALEEALTQLLTEHTAPCIMCSNAKVALRTLRVLDRLNAIDKTGFITFDEEAWSALVAGGITTIAQPAEHIGERAAATLYRQLHEESHSGQSHALPATLHIRRSTLNGADAQTATRQRDAVSQDS